MIQNSNDQKGEEVNSSKMMWHGREAAAEED